MTADLTPDRVHATLSAMLTRDILCEPEDSLLRVDTPFVLQDGHTLRVYLQAGGRNGNVVVSDGGFATEQVELLSPTRDTMRRRYDALEQIARELGIGWDGVFNFEESSLERAAQRLTVLAQAVDRAIALVRPRGDRSRGGAIAELRHDLERRGMRVRRRAPIRAGVHKVLVDLQVRRNESEAAVEVVGGHSRSSALSAIANAATDFHLLKNGGYLGVLVAAYEEDSRLILLEMRQRLRDAAPRGVEVIPLGAAGPRLDELLTG